MRAVISGSGSYLPARRMANDEFSRSLDTTDEWIVSHTGIKFRHIAADGEKASDIGLQAAQAALAKGNLDPADLDLVLVATSTGDFQGFPSTACLIQDRLGAKRAAAFDMTAACTGYVYALATASAFVESGMARHVLVVGTEVMSRVLDWSDRATCVLFGDGAGATLLSAGAYGEGAAERGVIGSIIRSDGAGVDALKIETVEGEGRACLRMDGRIVYNFALRVMTELIDEISGTYGVSLSDFKAIVPHQANVRIIKAAAKRLGAPEGLFYINMDRVANTSAASIPIALDEMSASGLLRQGDLILTIGFGGGLTWGANLIRW